MSKGQGTLPCLTPSPRRHGGGGAHWRTLANGNYCFFDGTDGSVRILLFSFVQLKSLIYRHSNPFDIAQNNSRKHVAHNGKQPYGNSEL